MAEDVKSFLQKFLDDEEERRPGFKESLLKPKPRDIKSYPPVACTDGDYECYVPVTGMMWDGQIYQCKLCKKRFIHRILNNKDGSWNYKASGWYLQNDSFVDIIKSWFKR